MTVALLLVAANWRASSSCSIASASSSEQLIIIMRIALACRARCSASRCDGSLMP